jgi:hypothetical protein
VGKLTGVLCFFGPRLESRLDNEPREILRLLALTESDGMRPFAYLFQKRLPKK